MNAPSQRAWITDTGGKTGAGQMATGRVSANQLKTLPAKDYAPSWIASRRSRARGTFRLSSSPTEHLLTNPGLGGRLQVTSTQRCAISVYNPGDVAPAHVHSANASRTILSDEGGYTSIEGERCEAKRAISSRHRTGHGTITATMLTPR